ncbi:hypothetical protein [Micromonospora echinaurantiaca]|uniref:hypothetical protein n=1 Tax=Micromonospora echinaurantiaca TaxID=47857 RepID=UPI0037A03B58
MAWALWPTTSPPPRERHYRSTTACLLTDDKGLAGEHAKAAWAGMQEASQATLIKVQYLSVQGPQTAANASAYFNTLALQKCNVIVAAGEAPVAAMIEGHSRFPDAKHVAVDGKTKESAIVDIQATTREAITATTKTIVSESA